MAVVERAKIYKGTRIPSPIPTILQVDPALRDDEDILQVNFGPNHPSTHGVLRLVVDLNGEQVVGLEAVVGYLHTGFEKNMEQKTWWKAITYPERIDYLSFQYNELVFVLAIEKLLAVTPPAKATWMRTLLCELNRIHSHLIWLGTAALEIGAIVARAHIAAHGMRPDSFRDPQPLAQIRRGIAILRVPAFSGIADTSNSRIDCNACAIGVIFYFREVRRVEAFVVLETRKLNGVELLAGSIIQKLDVLPTKVTNRKRIEPEPDAITGQIRSRG